MSLGKKILQNAGYRTAYKVPANKKSTVNLTINAQADSDFKVVVTDIAASPLDIDGVNLDQVFSSAQASGSLGFSVSIDGDYAVVGRPSANANVVGLIQIYFFDGFSWSLQQTIIDPANDPDAEFGYSVAIDGENIIVGARGNDQTATNSGRAYRYRRSGTVWSLVDTYISPAAVDAAFGTAVAISGDYILVSAVGVQTVYGYRVSTGAVLQVTFTNPGGANLDVFGPTNGVAVWSDGSVLIGATGFSNQAGVGRAYYYPAFANANINTIINPNAPGTDQFGRVTCDKTGNLFAIGAGSFSTARGRVYTYDKRTPTVVVQTIDAPDLQTNQLFGRGLSMSTHGGLLIGAFTYDANGIIDQGIAYRYIRSGVSWVLAETLLNPTPAVQDFFGFGVALREDLVGDSVSLVGAYGDSTQASGGGSVYFYTKGIFSEASNFLSLESDQVTDQVSLITGETFERTGLVVDAGESVIVLSRDLTPDLRISVRGFEEDA